MKTPISALLVFLFHVSMSAGLGNPKMNANGDSDPGTSGEEKDCVQEAALSSVAYHISVGMVTDDSSLNFLTQDLVPRLPAFTKYTPPQNEPDPTLGPLVRELGDRLEQRVILGLMTDSLDEKTFTPAALELKNGMVGNPWVKRDDSGSLRQVLTSRYLTDITVPEAGAVRITVYYRPSIGKLDTATGLYTIPPKAFILRDIKICRPSPTNRDTLDIESLHYQSQKKPPKVEGFRWILKETDQGGRSSVISTYDSLPSTPGAVARLESTATDVDLGNGLRQKVIRDCGRNAAGMMVEKSVSRALYRDLGGGGEKDAQTRDGGRDSGA